MYGCEHFVQPVSSCTESVSNLQQPQLDLGGLTHRGQLFHVGHLIRLFSSGGKKKTNSRVPFFGVLGAAIRAALLSPSAPGLKDPTVRGQSVFRHAC